MASDDSLKLMPDNAKKELPPLKFNGRMLFGIFCAIVFLGMVGLVFYNAFLRYVMRSSFPPSEEWARFLFMYIIYFGAIEASYRKKHIVVDLLVERLHGWTRRIVNILANLCSVAALTLLVFGGMRIVELTYDIESVATHVNMAFINSPLPIMAFVTLVLTLRDIWLELRGKTVKTPPPDYKNPIEDE